MDAQREERALTVKHFRSESGRCIIPAEALSLVAGTAEMPRRTGRPLMASLEAELLFRLAELSSASVEAINACIERSGEFREMLEECTRCREAARELRSSLPHDQERVEEFEDLSHQLESELLQFLQEHSRTDTVP